MTAEPHRLVEVPSRPPWLGRLLELRADPLAMLIRLVRTHGDFVRFRVFHERVCVVAHPDLVEELLVKHRDVGRDRVTLSLKPVLGEGLLTAEGQPWRQQRSRMAPSFTPRQVVGYGDVMVETARATAPPAGRQNLHPYFSALTFDVVIRTLFGMQPGGEAAEVAPLLDSMMDAFEIENRTLWRFVPWRVPGPHRRRVTRGVERLDAVFAGLIARARANPDERTLAARIMEARDEHGRPMGDVQLRDELLTMILAGHETTALTLTYTVWQLAEHPEIQAALHAEVDAVLGDRPCTVDDLPRLEGIAAAVKESNRLFPPAWTVARETHEPLVLGGVELPRGTQILAPQWVVHRDPRWYPDPLAFRPDRWRSGETDDLPRFAYFPFGGGPRVCIGNHFATMEAALLLATFLQGHRVTADPGFAPSFLAAVTVRPRDGVWVHVHPRDAA